MCIRDSVIVDVVLVTLVKRERVENVDVRLLRVIRRVQDKRCLLYPSDAADERSSGDLGGRRILKKKKNKTIGNRKRKFKNQNR